MRMLIVRVLSYMAALPVRRTVAGVVVTVSANRRGGQQ